MIDLLDYLRGDGRLYELVNNWGSYEIVQTQTEAKDVFYHVKNSQWEELWADDVFIYRGTDTSPGNDELYMLSENSHYGSAWVPRWFEVGQTFKRTATVIWRVKSTGASIASKPTGVAVTYLRLERIYSTLTFDSGIQLQDVAELNAYLDNGGQPASSPWEKYFYARGYGLVSFQDMLGGFHSWIAQKFTPETMPQRVREKVSWLAAVQKRYYLPALPTTTATGQYIASQMNSAWVNVRAYPHVNAKDLGDLNKGETVTLYTPEVDGWIKVKKDALVGWVSYQNGAVAFTPTTDPDPDPDPGDDLPTVMPLGQYTLSALPASWVNIRDYPNASGADIGDLHKGDEVTLYTPDVDGWVYLDTGTVEGWVSRQNGKVSFTEVEDDDPIPPDDLPELPTVTPLGQYTLTKMPGTWVNVRAYPDTVAGADVGDLHKGDVVTLYTPEVNGWVFVEMGSVRGWVYRQNGKVDFTSVNAPNPTPIPPDDLPELPTVTPFGQFELTKMPGTWVNVRAYPDTVAGADVGDLHKGDVVTLYTPEVNGWVFVEMGSVRGWVYRQNGKVDFTASGGASAAALAAVRTLIMPETASRKANNKSADPTIITSGGATDENGNSIVPFDDNPFSSVGFANTKEDAIRLRDAFQQVEEGARRIRAELERIISRMR